MRAMDGKLQLSPYVDSNVQESLIYPDQTFGLKLRGDLSRELSGARWSLDGTALAQTLFDAVFYEQSKLIVRPEFGAGYLLSPGLHFLGRFTHFRKTFPKQSRSYRWTEYDVSLRSFPLSRLTVTLGYFTRLTAFRSYDTIHFHDNSLEMRGRYELSPRVFLEGAVATGTITYADYLAWEIGDSGLLTRSHHNQRDESAIGSIHIRYQGKVIVGVHLGYESLMSNSIISEYDLVTIRTYLSGRWGKSVFYHLLLQRVNKNYTHPRLRGLSGYRDPEETIQNRTYVQVERVLKRNTIGFIQVSLLQNETFFNQQYYDKTIVELGIKFEL